MSKAIPKISLLSLDSLLNISNSTNLNKRWRKSNKSYDPNDSYTENDLIVVNAQLLHYDVVIHLLKVTIYLLQYQPLN